MFDSIQFFLCIFQPDYDENEENKPKSFFRAFGSKDKARKKYGELVVRNVTVVI